MRYYPNILLYLIFLGALLLVVSSVRGGGGLFHYLNLQKSKAILSITIEELKAEIKAMEKEIDRIESSKSYALRILKDKYHLTTKDEEVLFFAD